MCPPLCVVLANDFHFFGFRVSPSIKWINKYNLLSEGLPDWWMLVGWWESGIFCMKDTVSLNFLTHILNKSHTNAEVLTLLYSEYCLTRMLLGKWKGRSKWDKMTDAFTCSQFKLCLYTPLLCKPSAGVDKVLKLKQLVESVLSSL